MTRQLNLDDIQGNVTRSYGRFSFPCARYFFLHIDDTASGRQFLDELRAKVTTAARWTPESKPKVTLNVGFTFTGLHKLGLPTRTLKDMPDEFVDGMKARAFVLGDNDTTKVSSEDDHWCKHWDPIWQTNRLAHDPRENVHLWVSMNSQVKPGTDQPVDDLEKQTEWLRKLCSKYKNQVRILATNGQNGDQEYQAATALFETLPNGDKIPTPKEHFGFTDGIGDPVFEGQHTDEVTAQAVVGRGKWMGADTGWQPLATGEFILGHPDESQELPPTAMPPGYMHNGTFMVYRKLHENVSSFNDVIDQEAKSFASVMGVSQDEAEVTLQAKMIGRWPDGVPLSKVPTYKEWQSFRQQKGFDDPRSTQVRKGLQQLPEIHRSDRLSIW